MAKGNCECPRANGKLSIYLACFQCAALLFVPPCSLCTFQLSTFHQLDVLLLPHRQLIPPHWRPSSTSPTPYTTAAPSAHSHPIAHQTTSPRLPPQHFTTKTSPNSSCPLPTHYSTTASPPTLFHPNLLKNHQ